MTPTSADDDVVAASEAAILLGAHVETVRRLARRGVVPAFKVGKDWRFSRRTLSQWVDAQQRGREAPLVLVVDDDALVRRAVTDMAQRLGCRVAAAASGSEGVTLVRTSPPDLVLLDLHMPGMNGPAFLRAVRPEHPTLPVVIVTGYPDSALMQQALQFAPLLLMAKPIEREHLARTIGVILRPHDLVGVAS